ncbi:MAG: hypothetical protein QNJ54_37905 [Prochloraceae cyanobacterium]|nr:hypothetical protein [Prochloraceae cyanobacterium]
MTSKSLVNYFVAVSELGKPPEEQEGILIEVKGQGGDTQKNREKALSIIQQMWSKGEIEVEKFPDGINDDNIFYVSSEAPKLKSSSATQESQTVLPVVQGAQEIIQLTKLQIEVQETAAEASPYVEIIKTVLERNRPLTAEEKDLAKDKKYGKTIEKLGLAIANQEEYQEQCTGNGHLILNAIAWQLSQETGRKI